MKPKSKNNRGDSETRSLHGEMLWGANQNQKQPQNLRGRRKAGEELERLKKPLQVETNLVVRSAVEFTIFSPVHRGYLHRFPNRFYNLLQ